MNRLDQIKKQFESDTDCISDSDFHWLADSLEDAMKALKELTGSAQAYADTQAELGITKLGYCHALKKSQECLARIEGNEK